MAKYFGNIGFVKTVEDSEIKEEHAAQDSDTEE